MYRFTYVQNEINGEATLTRPDGSQEVLQFNQGSKHGQAEEHFKDGSREIHTYVDGVLEGDFRIPFLSIIHDDEQSQFDQKGSYTKLLRRS